MSPAVLCRASPSGKTARPRCGLRVVGGAPRRAARTDQIELRCGHLTSVEQDSGGLGHVLVRLIRPECFVECGGRAGLTDEARELCPSNEAAAIGRAPARRRS